MNFTAEHAEQLGQLADELDTILYSAKLPLSAATHAECLTLKVREARDRIAAVVREATGEDPWAANPLKG